MGILPREFDPFEAEFRQRIIDGELPDRPREMGDDLWALMDLCRKPEAADRPNAEQVIRALTFLQYNTGSIKKRYVSPEEFNSVMNRPEAFKKVAGLLPHRTWEGIELTCMVCLFSLALYTI